MVEYCVVEEEENGKGVFYFFSKRLELVQFHIFLSPTSFVVLCASNYDDFVAR